MQTSCYVHLHNNHTTAEAILLFGVVDSCPLQLQPRPVFLPMFVEAHSEVIPISKKNLLSNRFIVVPYMIVPYMYTY